MSEEKCINHDNLTEEEIMRDYQQLQLEWDKKQRINTEIILNKVKEMVSESYYSAINEFLKDDEHGIWGELKIVDKPIGEWQEEYDAEYTYEGDYWSILKGMYVNQSCGYSGDDYHGTLEVNLIDNLYLRVSFSL